MGRKSTHNLIREVLNSLGESPKNITELAKDTRLDRTAISNYLKILKESEIVGEKIDGTRKQYFLLPSFRTDTYFGLPLEPEVQEKIYSIFHRIAKVWKKHSSQKLLSTNVQKIVYKVIRECGLDTIPNGWYIHGGIGVAVFNDSTQYNYAGLDSQVETCVDEVTADYASKKSWEVKREQYDSYANDLYKVKEDIFKILYGPGIHGDNPKNSLHMMIKFLRRMFSYADNPNRSKYQEIINAYQDIIQDITAKLDDETIKSHVQEITQLYEAVWKYLALFNFKKDLKNFYSEELLDNHFALDIGEQEEIVISLGTELQSLIPVEEDETRKSFTEALSKIELNAEEQTSKSGTSESIRKKAGLE